MAWRACYLPRSGRVNEEQGILLVMVVGRCLEQEFMFALEYSLNMQAGNCNKRKVVVIL